MYLSLANYIIVAVVMLGVVITIFYLLYYIYDFYAFSCILFSYVFFDAFILNQTHFCYCSRGNNCSAGEPVDIAH